MIVLTLDAQNNRIVIEDNEAEDQVDLGMVSLSNCDLWAQFPDAHNTVVTKTVLSEVDFEGLVFRLIDKNGQQWSTEIIGMTVTGQY